MGIGYTGCVNNNQKERTTQMARTRRAKLPTTAWYHLIARVTDRQFLLQADEKKSHFVSLLHRTLEFSGVELGTYAIMDNHFHLLVRVPEACELDDREILRRIAVLSGVERASEVEEKWAKWRKIGQVVRYEADRMRYLRRMYDVSQFMKTLKELYTMWYNRTYHHIGTLWTGRFKSLLVEDGDYPVALRAYIEANPVRAGIVDAPADYPWNGIGAAQRGDPVAQRGQTLLDGEVAGAHAEGGRKVPAGRVVAFSNGKILGGQGFVTRIVRQLGFFSRRTHAWPLRETEFGNRVFAALGYKEDSIALLASA